MRLQAQPAHSAATSLGRAGGALSAQSTNLPHRKKQQDREREERGQARADAGSDRRHARKRQDGREGIARYYAPEEIKARLAARQQQLDEEMARKKELDAAWDDCYGCKWSKRRHTLLDFC